MNNTIPLESQIEAILFWKGEPVKIATLSKILKKTDEEITAGLEELKNKFEGRGVQLIFKDDEVDLGTRAELGGLIETLAKEELSRDLGKAGLETLSIILYRAGVTRRDIDYIRGVNSTFIVRNLLVRGLVEKIENPADRRSFCYKPTFQLLSYLGISSVSELPEYETVRKEMSEREKTLEKIEEAQNEQKNEEK